MRKREKTVIAILGMHRSGTSLAGQMVHALGVPMGDSLIVANEYNERGYFEDSVVVKIHDELLLALGRPWKSISSTMPLPADWLRRPATATAREKLRAYLKVELRQGTRAVKDPRMARILPLWMELATEVGFDLIPLLCVRSPSEVARSLATRDHFPLNMGELLWTIYNFEIVDALGSSVDCVLCYEDWFKHPTENLNRLAAAIKVKLTERRCQELASTVVDTKLRHHVTKKGAESGPNAEFYRLLQLWADNSSVPKELATLLTIIRDSGALFAPWHEARETSYMAEAEEARIAEQARITASAEEYLRAYQDTEQARLSATAQAEEVSALEALKHVEQERDTVAAQAREYLGAYHVTEQARAAALEAIKCVEYERDAAAAQAKIYHDAYQESERTRLNSLCQRLYRLATFKWMKK